MTEPKQSFTEEVQEAKEYWLEKIERETGTELAVWDFRPPFEAEFASCEKDFIHVIEYSALVAERARRSEVEEELEQYRGYLKKAIDRGAKQVDELTTLRAQLAKARELYELATIELVTRDSDGDGGDGEAVEFWMDDYDEALELQKKGQGDE